MDSAPNSREEEAEMMNNESNNGSDNGNNANNGTNKSNDDADVANENDDSRRSSPPSSSGCLKRNVRLPEIDGGDREGEDDYFDDDNNENNEYEVDEGAGIVVIEGLPTPPPSTNSSTETARTETNAGTNSSSSNPFEKSGYYIPSNNNLILEQSKVYFSSINNYNNLMMVDGEQNEDIDIEKAKAMFLDHGSSDDIMDEQQQQKQMPEMKRFRIPITEVGGPFYYGGPYPSTSNGAIRNQIDGFTGPTVSGSGPIIPLTDFKAIRVHKRKPRKKSFKKNYGTNYGYHDCSVPVGAYYSSDTDSDDKSDSDDDDDDVGQRFVPKRRRPRARHPVGGAGPPKNSKDPILAAGAGAGAAAPDAGPEPNSNVHPDFNPETTKRMIDSVVTTYRLATKNRRRPDPGPIRDLFFKKVPRFVINSDSEDDENEDEHVNDADDENDEPQQQQQQQQEGGAADELEDASEPAIKWFRATIDHLKGRVTARSTVFSYPLTLRQAKQLAVIGVEAGFKIEVYVRTQGAGANRCFMAIYKKGG